MENFKDFLDQIVAIQGVHDEASFEETFTKLYALVEPKDSPREMGESFKEVVGYNPITYHNEKTIEESIDFMKARCSEYPNMLHRLNSMQDVIRIGVLNELEKKRVPNVASIAWGYFRDQIDDLGEIPANALQKISQDYAEHFGMQERVPVKPKENKEKHKHRSFDSMDDEELDRLSSGMDDIVLDESDDDEDDDDGFYYD